MCLSDFVSNFLEGTYLREGVSTGGRICGGGGYHGFLRYSIFSQKNATKAEKIEALSINTRLCM